MLYSSLVNDVYKYLGMAVITEEPTSNKIKNHNNVYVCMHVCGIMYIHLTGFLK